MEFLEEATEIEPNDVNRLAMLCLTNTTGEALPGKKRSPHYYSSSLHQPNPKRKSLHPPPPHHHHPQPFHGFSKISLPTPLHRSSSLPLHYPIGALDSANLPLTPDNNPSPPPAPVSSLLRRTLSDPTPAVTDTPPRHSSAVKSPSSVCQKSSSPNAKRLKRMKDRMKEMKQWCEELIREEDEEDTNNNTTHQFVEELNDPEESKCKPAWAETTGESSIIHFNCLCGKAYQLLLYANSCYYMLMPFEQENCETETQEMISVERNGEWLSIYTQCPCTNGYMILLRGSDCYYKLIDSVSS